MYDDVLVHVAQPVRTETGTTWIEGVPEETEQTPVTGEQFPCCLFLPLAGEQIPPRGRRVVKVPTLLMATYDNAGNSVSIGPADELLVTAPELPGHATPVRYQVDGAPQPFGPPGEELVGLQVTLKRVED